MYGKHFASTYTGSMIGAGFNVFAVWGYVIAHTVKSRIELNPILLSALLGGPAEEVQKAIDYLCQPDAKSRCKESGGRRLIREGEYQYFVVNHEKYRSIKNEDERREYLRIAKQRSRQRMSSAMSISQGVSSAVSTHTEAEAEAEADNNIPCPNSDDFRLSGLLCSLILARKPDFKRPNLQSWAKHIDRMIRLDRRTPERIEQVIRWCQQDSFWQSNILSTEKLREKFDQLDLKIGKQNGHRETRTDRRNQVAGNFIR